MGIAAHQKGLNLLRSALLKCSPRSATSALTNISDCYYLGMGVPESQSNTEMLRACVERWKQPEDSAISLPSLRNDRQLMGSHEPEQHILRLITEEFKALKGRSRDPVRRLADGGRRLSISDTEKRVSFMDSELKHPTGVGGVPGTADPIRQGSNSLIHWLSEDLRDRIFLKLPHMRRTS